MPDGDSTSANSVTNPDTLLSAERAPVQVLSAGGPASPTAPSAPTESVTEPGKVMRIGSMIKQLLEEARGAQLDLDSRERLAEIYERSIVELSAALSPDLQHELHMLALPFGDRAPSDSELRIAQAQLVGWLEGLFHGIQATLFAQQIAARQQFEQMRGLGQGGPGSPETGQGEVSDQRPGTYL